MNATSENVIVINNQNIGSDQSLTLRPSRGLKGSMLKASNIALL